MEPILENAWSSLHSDAQGLMLHAWRIVQSRYPQTGTAYKDGWELHSQWHRRALEAEEQLHEWQWHDTPDSSSCGISPTTNMETSVLAPVMVFGLSAGIAVRVELTPFGLSST
eukprot:4050828-Amphidinium_carterae.2